ncbi:MAG: hypothetical protein ACW98F_02525 [Candidatus Hodarchaeales archaeon]
MAGNPLKQLEQEYILLVLQYLHLNPRGKTFSQVCNSIEHNADPKKVTSCLKTLSTLGLIYEIKTQDNNEILFVLSNRGRYASEIVWDLFRIILNPHERSEDDPDFLDFYR